LEAYNDGGAMPLKPARLWQQTPCEVEAVGSVMPLAAGGVMPLGGGGGVMLPQEGDDAMPLREKTMM
jgi:hypothetical protein